MVLQNLYEDMLSSNVSTYIFIYNTCPTPESILA